MNAIAAGNDIDEPLDVAQRMIKEKGRMLSIVYSGGDDLFIIGHWLDVAETAIDIHNYFKKYTGNPFMTISGGIAINHEKYPVYQYARDSEEGEKRAKTNKDAITLFGTRDFKWDGVGKIVERVSLFCRFLKFDGSSLVIDEDKLSKTFFYRLLALSRRFTEDGVLILPKAAYLISRVKLKGNPEDNMKLKEVVMNSNRTEWRITEASVLWTLMLIRKGGE